MATVKSCHTGPHVHTASLLFCQAWSTSPKNYGPTDLPSEEGISDHLFKGSGLPSSSVVSGDVLRLQNPVLDDTGTAYMGVMWIF